MNSGWGYQNESGDFSPALREIKVPIVPMLICNSVMHYVGRVDPISMLCAGSGGADACQVLVLRTIILAYPVVIPFLYERTRGECEGETDQSVMVLDFLTQARGLCSPVPTVLLKLQEQ